MSISLCYCKITKAANLAAFVIISYLTVTVHSNVSPAACTEIVADPGDTAVTLPVLSTLATELLLLRQLLAVAQFFILSLADLPDLSARERLLNVALGTVTEHE